MSRGSSDREVHDLVARVAGTEPPVRAPGGLVDRVMQAVYRESLRGGALEPPEVAGRTYRRIGLSFVLAAALVAAALVAPAGVLPGALGPAGLPAALGTEQSVVKRALVGADALVRGALRPTAAASVDEGGAAR